ncbi:metal-dependent transcriptional regulator [Demequina sp.]|uniref:metal-dependent transcriptional regulator n=1 Tax=Demequina sp. TaxID=2050685 RepID=UPI003D10DFB5
MTDTGSLSPSTQDYLKALWSLGEWDPAGITVTALAERLGVRTSTASDGVRKLADQGFVEHAPYGAIVLTPAGTAHALAMVRRHRLIETFLEQELGYSWDEVHDEAEALEHAVSDTFLARIDERLGHPTRDPHGDPIPPASGPPPAPDAVLLASVTPGTRAVVTRISDASPERLRAFAAAGILPDAVVTLRTDGELAVGQATYLLAEGDAEALWVSPAP